MNSNDIACDRSSTVSYQSNIIVENSRLSPKQRKAAYEIIVRHTRALMTQLEMLAPDKSYATMQRISAVTGETSIDLGAQTDE